MKKLLLAALVASSFSAVPAFAQGWYVGAGIGRGDLDINGTDLGLPNASVGDNATTYTARLGLRFNRHFAAEVGYYDLGEYDFSSDFTGVNVRGTAKAKAFALSAVGIVPLSEAFELYGRVGYGTAELKVNASANGFVGNDKDNQRGTFYGAGARWNLGPNWGLFAEWMRADKIEVDSYLGGVEFRF